MNRIARGCIEIQIINLDKPYKFHVCTCPFYFYYSKTICVYSKIDIPFEVAEQIMAEIYEGFEKK